jgi:CubicO group peptidase (beta-lactamase class C family)
MPDLDVSVSNGKVLWDHHEGVLGEKKDTMTVAYERGREKSLWRFVRNRSADALMAQLLTYSATPYDYKPPENLEDGWECGDLAASGMEKSRIVELIEEIRDGKHDDIHSLLVVKDGRLVVEEYFAVNGRKHGPLTTGLFRDRVHHLASTTKSVTSTLVGIAIDKGYIKDAEEPIFHFLPAYDSLFNQEKKRIRICDMLTMTPGFEWHQFGVSDARNDGMQMWRTDDVIRYVLQKPLDAEPGKTFNYSNGTPTVTGAILRNAVGMEVTEFADQYLFRPLGITAYSWTSYPDGSIETDGGLALRPRDLAKLGQMFLNNGVWHSQRIVSESWIRESTKERLRFGRRNRWGYGYHWMQAETRIGDRVVRSYFVPGDGNQILAVFPELNMVVVFTAGNYGVDPKEVYYSLFEEFVLPAVLFRG